MPDNDKWAQYAVQAPAAAAPAADKWDQYVSAAPVAADTGDGVGADDQAATPPPAAVPTANQSIVERIQAHIDKSTGPSTEPNAGARAVDNLGRGVAASTVGVAAHPWEAIKSIFAQATDPVAAMQTVKQLYGQPVAYSVGQFLGPALFTHAFGGIMGAAGDTAAGINPAPSYVSPVEMGVRGLVKSLKLPVNMIEPTVQNLLGVDGDGTTMRMVQAWAAKEGKPINTPLDFAKGARAAADDLKNHYQNDILGPHKDVWIKFDDNFSPIQNRSDMATLGNIDKRIADINKQLDQAYQAEANGNPSPIAKAPLEAEADRLRSVLYPALAKQTGLPESTVARIRTGYGKLYGVEDAMTRAVNGQTTRMQEIPKSTTEAAIRIAHKAAGSEEGSFNRKFRNSLPDFPVQPQP